jgi:23S rRNA pseudouridine1911/1915/1917 synthase
MKYSDNDPLYCDNHLLVMNKPAGMSTQPHFEEAAKEWVKAHFKKEGAVFLHPIHRLDRPVNGLVLFARTSKALSRLNEQMREGKIQRTYEAEVEGCLPQSEGALEHYLVHGSHRALLSDASDSEAKSARLTYRVVQRGSSSTKILIELQTGRYHQIRAQFAAIGHPVLGDQLYGAKRPAEKISLRCQKLAFLHPTTKEQVVVEIP